MSLDEILRHDKNFVLNYLNFVLEFDHIAITWSESIKEVFTLLILQLTKQYIIISKIR